MQKSGGISGLEKISGSQLKTKKVKTRQQAGEKMERRGDTGKGSDTRDLDGLNGPNDLTI
jgi:hypothetical protein